MKGGEVVTILMIVFCSLFIIVVWGGFLLSILAALKTIAVPLHVVLIIWVIAIVSAVALLLLVAEKYSKKKEEQEKHHN